MINFIILTKTKNKQIFQMTNNLIQSIKNTIYPQDTTFSNYRIIIIQSQKDCQYNYNQITIQYDQQIFNYNHAINQSIDYCLNNFDQNDWFCFMNNDLICDKNWINQINKIYELNNNILSFSPNTNTSYILKGDYQFGYILHKHLKGYLIFCHKIVIDKICKFDELFDFYFQDDDYLQQLRKYNILHAVVKNSNIVHLGEKTQNTNYKKLIQDRNKFISKYGIDIYNKRQKQKYVK